MALPRPAADGPTRTRGRRDSDPPGLEGDVHCSELRELGGNADGDVNSGL